MEFPHLGANCSFASCNKLDFLPMKCDACRTSFCSEHFSYTSHGCPAGGRRDVQVPECPLCGAPVPGRRGEAPDVAVGAHIDNDCRASPACQRRNKVFTHRCSHAGCRGRELVPMLCAECRLNFCIRHRHAADHSCVGAAAARRARVAEAATNRLKSLDVSGRVPVRTHTATVQDIQGNMTEDEALAHALSLSLRPSVESNPHEPGRPGQPPPPVRARVGGDTSRCALS